MNRDTLQSARSQAETFLKAIEEADKAVALKDVDILTGNKYTAKIRRTSMDLTRALANLRRPS